MTDDNKTGKLTIRLTHGSIERQVLEVCRDLTADGERLLVLDAADYLNPRRFSRLTASAARNIHVFRIASGAELHAAVSAELHGARERSGARRILLTGILDHLSGRQILTRETARELGRIKLALVALADSGLQVTVLCRVEACGPASVGTRAYLVSSLCAIAREVYGPVSNSQQYVDGASAAIA